MLERAFAAQTPCAFLTGDSVYGADYALRRFVEMSGSGYVLAVASTQSLGFLRVKDWLGDVPARGLEAAERRRRRQGPAPLRLGLGAEPVGGGGGLAEGPAHPPQDR